MTTSTGPRLEPITPANIEAALAIRVRPEQEFAVDPVVKSSPRPTSTPGRPGRA